MTVVRDPFQVFSSAVIPFPAENIDTDQIVPARFLKVTDRWGLSEALFADWRFDDAGNPHSEFILNQPEMRGRQVLLAGDNFGCGSSREHAPWALVAWGIRVILSTSFADIFRNNALKNGLLPIVVEPERYRQLTQLCAENPSFELTVDLEAQRLHLPGDEDLPFDIDPFVKLMILKGTDELGYLVSKEPDIERWEAAHPPPIDTTLGQASRGTNAASEANVRA